MIESIALTYESALRQAEIESTLLYDSKIPVKCNSDVWIKRLERINQNKGMTPKDFDETTISAIQGAAGGATARK